ncbi:hypothetical protein [Achromobacter insolitus]|uniref:hypothetical protein n=1 Tax=Achromobacter insolitus TaxID=217204 RepID=UPI0007C3E389|nr:hypothetical protein [Achromobacter insolitus]OAD17128.1 hypothetical protein A3839_24305 [Achromobacter insolitus]
MALNASIPLQYQSPQIQSYTNALFDATRLRAAEQDVADQQRMSAERNALADVLRQGQVFDERGQLTPGGLGQVAQAAPSMVPAYAQMANQQTRMAQQDQRQNVQLAMQRQDWARQGIAASQTPDQARAYVESGLQSGILDPQTAQQILGQIPADAATYGQWRTGIARQLMTPAQIAELERGTYSAPVQTNQGFAQIDRNGNVRIPTGPNGQPLMPVTLDAGGQQAVAEAKARGTAQGKAQVENEQGFGQAEATANQIMGVIDQAINHPGRGYATGASSMLPILPGTDAADFRAVLDQIKGQAFLQAFETLKGGGQITEVEGQKATQAIARLDRAQSEAEFVKSLQELRGIVASGLERARRKAGAAGQQTGAQPSGPASRPSLTDIFGN